MKTAVSLLQPTPTERGVVRERLWSEGPTTVTIWENPDGSCWAAEVWGVVIEGTSPVGLLRDLAEILLEA